MKLTDRIEYSAASLTDLIHIVVTSDTSQDPAGSSYKIPVYKILNLVQTPTYWTSGSTGNYSVIQLTDSITDATANYAYAEGVDTLASGIASHAEGSGTTASGDYSHAQGRLTTASANTSHAEGDSTIASGKYSHAEGVGTTASGDGSHTEGENTIASGTNSHAGGQNSTASGSNTFVHGSGSTVSGQNSMVIGNNITGTRDDSVYVGPLIVKNLSASEITILPSPVNGLIVYDTTNNQFKGYANGSWVLLG